MIYLIEKDDEWVRKIFKNSHYKCGNIAEGLCAKARFIPHSTKPNNYRESQAAASYNLKNNEIANFLIGYCILLLPMHYVEDYFLYIWFEGCCLVYLILWISECLKDDSDWFVFDLCFKAVFWTAFLSVNWVFCFRKGELSLLKSWFCSLDDLFFKREKYIFAPASFYGILKHL